MKSRQTKAAAVSKRDYLHPRLPQSPCFGKTATRRGWRPQNISQDQGSGCAIRTTIFVCVNFTQELTIRKNLLTKGEGKLLGRPHTLCDGPRLGASTTWLTGLSLLLPCRRQRDKRTLRTSLTYSFSKTCLQSLHITILPFGVYNKCLVRAQSAILNNYFYK